MAFNSWRRPWRKGEIGKACAVELAVRVTTSRPKCLTMVVDLLARLHELRPKRRPRRRARHSRNMAATVILPLPKPPVRPTRSTGYSPRRIVAARTVFDISMAMVSKPTPPGTGV